MLYPIFSFEDGTEVTASKPDVNGKIFLYIEKFDINKDMFINATIELPGAYLKSSNGYTKDELDNMIKEYAIIQNDIISFIMEKEKKDA